MKKINFKLLDTTLRDGSYVNNFNINAKTTFEVASKLDDIGFHFIEIGHGLGMNATSFPSMRGVCTDIEWMKAAVKSVKKNKWGMFFIPGIGRFEDIDIASEYGMDFIRIGANANEFDKALPYVEYAKKKGLIVNTNFMKTYAVNSDQILEIAKKCENSGSDLNCIVDSAGCMLPESVEEYVNKLKIGTKIPIGFHGHNNLGMAISNSLAAIHAGADVIDTTLRGLGRSAGNTVTEIFLCVLERYGFQHDFDLFKIYDVSEKYIDKILNNYIQVNSLSIISGFTKFHSSFTKRVDDIAKIYEIDPRKLITELCKIDIIDAPEDLLHKLSKKIKNN